jgi:MFS transporter, SP family, sugar:H+ symporter
MKGRSDDCIKSLTHLREGRFSEDEIQEEYRILKANIDLTVEKGRVIEMFQRQNLKRTSIVMGTNLLLQLTGQNFVNSYGTLFIQDLGTVNPFSMITGYYAVNNFFTIITMFLTDRTGRM